MIPITASSLKRASICGASHVLPSVIESGEWADIGRTYHDYLDLMITGQTEKARKEYEDHELYGELLQLPVDKYIKGVFIQLTEPTFALEPVSGQVEYLGHHLNRKYPKKTGWIIGSADYIGFDYKKGHYVVNDWKTGEPVDPASTNLQLGFFAYVLHKLYSTEKVEVRITYTRDNTIDSHIYETELDYDLVLGRIRFAAENVQLALEQYEHGLSPTVYPSDECKYCTARYVCPKWAGVLREFVNGFQNVDLTDWKNGLSIDEVAKLWPLFKQLRQKFEEADKSVKELVKSSTVPIVLESGKHLKLIENKKDYVNGKRALALAKSYGASDEEIMSCFGETKYITIRESK